MQERVFTHEGLFFSVQHAAGQPAAVPGPPSGQELLPPAPAFNQLLPKAEPLWPAAPPHQVSGASGLVQLAPLPPVPAALEPATSLPAAPAPAPGELIPATPTLQFPLLELACVGQQA